MFRQKFVIMGLGLFLLFTRSLGQPAVGRDYLITVYNDKTQLPQNSVRSMQIDSLGFYWIATEMGLARFDGQNFRVFNTQNTPILTDNRMQIVCQLKGDLYTIDGRGKLFHINAGCQLLEKVPDQEKLLRAIFKSYIATYSIIQFIVEIANEREIPPIKLWYKDTLYKLNKEMSFVKSVSRTPLQEECSFTGPAAQYIKSIGNDYRYTFFHQDSLLFLSVNNRVFAITKSLRGFESRVLIDSLPFLDVMSFIYDARNQLYAVGSATYGLSIIRPRDFTTHTVPDKSKNCIYAQVSMGPRRLLASNGDIYYQDGRVNPLYEKAADLNIFSFLRDSNNQFYFGKNAYLLRTDSTLTGGKMYDTKLGDIRGLVQDREGAIWMGSYSDLFRLKNDSIVRMFTVPRAAFGWIEMILPQSEDSIWVAARNGLYLFNPKTGTSKIIPGMENKYVRLIKRLNDGSLWLGTYGQGFYLLHNNQFKQMPIDPGGSLLNVHCIIEDKHGFLWMPTNKGLFQFLKTDLYQYASRPDSGIYYHYYGEPAGFNTSEFNGGCTPCSVTFANGTYSLPSMNGLVWFNPDSINSLHPTAALIIDRVTVNNEILTCNSPKLLLGTGKQTVVLDITSPYMGDPHNLKIEYRIPGYSDIWEPLKNGQVILANLPYGDYIVEIRKRVGFGWSNYIYKQLPVSIASPWYFTWWFLAALILGLIGIIYATLHWRTRYLARNNEMLEQIITERTNELLQTNEFKENLTNILIHDLRSPMKFMSLIASRLHTKLAAKTSSEQVEEMARDLKSNALEIYNFIEETTIWIKSKQKNFSSKKERFKLADLLVELEHFFTGSVYLNGNTIVFEKAEFFVTDSYFNVLKVVLRNLIDNANKFTRHGNITVSARREPSLVVISILDNGKGIPDNVASFLENRSTDGSQLNVGLGFIIIKDMLRVLNAFVHVNENPGGGSVVSVHLPQVTHANGNDTATERL